MEQGQTDGPGGSVADWIDGLALVTSVSALGATIWSLRNDSKERRLAATPHLTFERWTNETARSLSINVANNGLGPAHISDYCFMVNGRSVLGLSGPHWQNIFEQLEIDGTVARATDLDKGQMLPPGFKMSLLEISDLKSTAGKSVRDSLRPLTICIEYRSIYGKLMRPE